MQHEDSYQGRRIVVTTKQSPAGDWTSRVEIVDDDREVTIAADERASYGSEDEARRAGLSAAAAAIDRARASRGKP